MKKVIPNIMVTNCREALNYYQNIFGGEIKNIVTTDGQEIFKGYEGKIVHSELQITPDCLLYFGDIFNETPAEGNVGLILELDSEAEINKLYTALSQKGSIKYELQKTFWGAWHAIVTDMYGVSWHLNHELS